MAMPKEGWTEADVEAVLTNPFYAVSIAPSLCGEHEPLIDRAQWVRANARLIAQIGAEAWLERLLDVLASGGVADDPPPPASSPPLPKNRHQRRLQQRRRARSDDQP